MTVNYFSVLDHDFSAPSTPPHSEFTFTYPPPCHFATSASIFAGPIAPDARATGPKRVFGGKQHIEPGLRSTQATQAPLNQLPSPPPTPPQLPVAKDVAGLDRNTVSTYKCPDLTNIRIPSPLLYHRRSREELGLSNSPTDRFRNIPEPPWTVTCDLVIPTLPDALEMIDTGRPFISTDKPSDFIDDDPEIVERMWNAFEATIYDKSPSYKPQIRERSNTSASEVTVVPENTIEVAACPTPTCTALVPARLYHQQFFG